MDTGIWKEIVDGMNGYPFFVLNVINLELEGSTDPRADSNAFRCVGHVLSTSRVDMAIGVWARLSIML